MRHPGSSCFWQLQLLGISSDQASWSEKSSLAARTKTISSTYAHRCYDVAIPCLRRFQAKSLESFCRGWLERCRITRQLLHYLYGRHLSVMSFQVHGTVEHQKNRQRSEIPNVMIWIVACRGTSVLKNPSIVNCDFLKNMHPRLSHARIQRWSGTVCLTTSTDWK